MAVARTEPFYFAWVEASETTFGAEHHVWDEQIESATVEHEEGGIPTLTVVMRNPREGLLKPGRRQHAWLSYDSGTDVIPIFFGRVTAVPGNLFEEMISAVFQALPADYNFQKRALADALRVAPNYDPVFFDLAKRDDPDAVLEGYSALFHVDRVTHEVTVSDIISAEDGVEVFNPADVPYDSVTVEYGEAPRSTVVIDSTVNWTQRSIGAVDLVSGGIASYGGDGIISEWPQPNAGMGGGWFSQFSIATDSRGVAGALTASWSYNYQNKNERHHNGDTLSVTISTSEPQIGGISEIMTTFAQDGEINPFAVDSEGNPAPINRPMINRYTYMVVALWNVGVTLQGRYEAARERTERVIIKMQSDLQPIVTDVPENEQTEVIEVSGSDIGIPIMRLTNWLAVRSTVVAVGTVIFPQYPDFPGVSIAQICTTGGMTGSAPPAFSPIEGVTTNDGAAVWTSLGTTKPDETPEDWTATTRVPLGDIIRPTSPSFVPRYVDLVRPGRLAFPPTGVSVEEGLIVRASNGSYQKCILSGVTATYGAPRGFYMTGDVSGSPLIHLYTNATEPAVGATWGETVVDGTVTWFCLGSTLPRGDADFIATAVSGDSFTGQHQPPFNATVGALTVDNDVTWTCIGLGVVPVGGVPGNTPRSSYFASKRGRRSIEYLICVGRAYLLNKSRVVKATFRVPFLRALDLSCRKAATLSYNRLPGGTATGKITAYTIEMNGGSGDFFGTVTIQCPIGNGATVTEVVGTPVYCDAAYTGSDYQQFNGAAILLPELEDITYAPPVAGVVDDGLVFPLTYGQVVLASRVHGSVAAQVAGIYSALKSAAKAAQLGEIQPTSAEQSIDVQRRTQSLNANSVGQAVQNAPIWYELKLKPVTGGPYNAVYALETSMLMVPKMIDLGAATMALEKVVRPAQTGQVTPPRRVIEASEGPTEQAGFKAGRGGSGKSMSGNYSFQQTFYCEQYVNEFRTAD